MIEISYINPKDLDGQNIKDINLLTALAFGRTDLQDMSADTERHIAESDSVQIATDKQHVVGFSMVRRSVNKSNLELAGRAIHPHYQRDRIASRMLKSLIAREAPDTLTTFTRNPRIVQMIAKQCLAVYPLVIDSQLEDIAKDLGVSRDFAVYHLNRYGESGLYGANDPAREPFGTSGQPFDRQFPGLQTPGNALVVVGRVKTGDTKL